ncbi:hypothetical protein HYX17_05285 [Candidatus Woesearchaeota archaeon]|nr:hypothetical protein [Candidatus Woesearchaeota archaeon]
MKFIDYLLDSAWIRLVDSTGDLSGEESRLLELVSGGTENIGDISIILERYNGGFREYFNERYNKLIETSRLELGYGN